MKNIKQKAGSFIKENGLFIVFVLAFFIVNALLTFSNDDVGRRALENASFLSRIKEAVRFAHDISPRYITYILTYGILYFNRAILICAVINTAALIGIIKGISDIYYKGTKYWLCIFLICLYPYTNMTQAGIVSTTMCYWLVTAAMLSALSLLKRIYKGGYEALNIPRKILYFVSVLICANQEQAVIVMTVVFILFLLITFMNKKKGAIVGAASLIIQLMGICTLFFGGGNKKRLAGEMLLWYKDYGMVSFIGKIQMAFVSSMNRVLFESCGLFVVLSLLIAFIIWYRYKNITKRLSAVIPLLLWGFAKFAPAEIQWVRPAIGQYGVVSVQTYTSLYTYAFIALICIIGGFTIINLCILSKNISELIRLVGTLVLGVSTRIMLGFSPTIWASADRTYIFMWFSLIMLISDIVGTYREDIENIKKGCDPSAVSLGVILAGSLAFMAFMNNYMSLIMNE